MSKLLYILSAYSDGSGDSKVAFFNIDPSSIEFADIILDAMKYSGNEYALLRMVQFGFVEGGMVISARNGNIATKTEGVQV